MALVQTRRSMRNGGRSLRILEHADVAGTLRIHRENIYLCPATPATSEMFNQILTYLIQVKPADVFALVCTC